MAKSDKFYFENYKERAILAKQSADYLVKCLENYDQDKLEDMLKEMHVFEHNADLKKHEMNRALAKAFVTPFDREDINMLSEQLDNVSDKLEEVLQDFFIYSVKEVRPDAIQFAHKLVESCEVLVEIMGELSNFKKSKSIHLCIVDCNDIEEECDKLYLAAMRQLTKNATDPITTISWIRLYDCLEECMDACESVCESIESVIMKNT